MLCRFFWAAVLLFPFFVVSCANGAPFPQNGTPAVNGVVETCDDQTVPPPEGCQGNHFELPAPSTAPTAGHPIGCVRTPDATFQTEFSWNAPPQPVMTYRVVVYRPSGVILDGILSRTSFPSGGHLNLTVGTPFHWQVWACTGGGCGPSSPPWYFTGCNLDVLPITGPAGCVDTLHPEIHWHPVPDVTGHRLIVTDTTNQMRVVDVQLGAYANSYLVPFDLVPGREYVAQVSSSSGNLSPWRYFTPQCTAGALPGTVSLSSPLGGRETHTSTNPLFIWEEAAQATEYRLFVVGASSTEIDQVYAASQICGAGQCAALNVTRLSLGVHSWQVQAINSAGSSLWSKRGAFVVGP